MHFLRDSLAIRERLARSHPRSRRLQRNLSLSYIEVGKVLAAHGDSTQKPAIFGDSSRAASPSSIPEAPSGRAICLRPRARLGKCWSHKETRQRALQSFRDSLAIRERLAKADPDNARWQLDLSGSYIAIGKVLRSQGNREEALQSFRDSQAIRERLAKADPGNARWQSRLANRRSLHGENLAQAQQSFRDSLAIRERAGQSRSQQQGTAAPNCSGCIMLNVPCARCPRQHHRSPAMYRK